MPLGMDEREALRQMIAEQIKSHLRDAMAQPQLWPAKGSAAEQVSVPSGSGGGSPRQLNNVAHRLAHTQVEISHTLEASLQNLQDLVDQAESIATKIRSLLRRTEPSKNGPS